MRSRRRILRSPMLNETPVCIETSPAFQFDHTLLLCSPSIVNSSSSESDNSKEMPPRRKRKAATREETKLKKQKDECLTRCIQL